MEIYKLFKKNNSILKTLEPMGDGYKSIVAKLQTDDDISIGYESDNVFYMDISQCPRLRVGSDVEAKDLRTGEKILIGKLIDINYNDDLGYLFIFDKYGEKVWDNKPN